MSIKNKKIKVEIVLKTIIIGILSLTFLLPLFWMLSSSLKTSMQVFESPFHWVEEQIRWDNYQRVWTHPEIPFYRLYMNSIIISVIGVVGQLVISSLAAYAFAKIDFKGKNILFMIMLITMMIPMQVMIIPRYILFRTLHIYNTLWCIIIPHFFSITVIFLLRQFYMGLPDALIEAARMDGAGHFKIWLHITMPLTRNGIISAAVLGFINTWNEYLNPLIFLSNQQKFTVTLGIRWYLQDIAKEYNLMMAAAASAIVPVVIFYIVAQDYFEEGIAAGSVKG